MAFKEIKIGNEATRRASAGTYMLRPIAVCPRDVWASRYARWTNDPEVTKYLYQGTIPASIEKCKKLYDVLTNDSNVVYDIINKTPQGDIDYTVGIVGVFEIYWPSRVGEFRILLGDMSHWGKGLGRACLEEMNHLAFDTLGLHKFWLGVNNDHKRAIGAYSKSGFKEECILEKHHYKNGAYSDLLRMRMFREDYEAWVKSKQD